MPLNTNPLVLLRHNLLLPLQDTQFCKSAIPAQKATAYRVANKGFKNHRGCGSSSDKKSTAGEVYTRIEDVDTW